MKTYMKLGLALAALIAIGGVVRAAGGAGNIVTSVSSTDLIPLDSGTLASDVQLSTLATFFNSGGGGNATFGAGVNQITLTGAATGSPPIIASGGASSDTNTSLAIDPKGTGALLLGGSTTTTAGLQVAAPASTVNDVILTPGATGTIPNISAGGAGADANLGLALKGSGTGNVLIGGITTSLAGLQVTQTASAVNDFVATNAATGNTPGFEAGGAGSDASVGVAFGTQGTGQIAFDTGATLQQFVITHTASAVDALSCTGAVAGNPGAVPCSAAGTDTNVSLNLIPKGSGIVRLGAATVATCSGTTTATCQGQQFVVSITGLTTAASTLSAAMVVTDATVISSSNIVMCAVQGYAGTGVPLPVIVTPGTGSVSLKIQNVSTGAALNATVAVACNVVG